MAKKQFNVRLTDDVILAIKIKAKERGCSEAELIEHWATGVSSSGRTADFDSVGGGSTPPAPAIPTGYIAPKPSTASDKREIFEMLKANLSGNRAGLPSIEPDLSNTPAAPFDLSYDGEPHRVAQMGKKLFLFYLGNEGAQSVRQLKDGELETLWEKRITS